VPARSLMESRNRRQASRSVWRCSSTVPVRSWEAPSFPRRPVYRCRPLPSRRTDRADISPFRN